MAKKGLRSWVQENWVDIANKKPDGSYPKCGRSGGEKRKNYPKCVPIAKARALPGKVKPGSKAAKRRKSFCARSAGQMKKFPKAAADPNSRLRQARRRWKC
jgi:hypothetical protein